ncbi:hypothetical protein E05_38770 [Plautia stali symbiont]|nr:hypothetical protein E05_38770 [Plautia stali symbiont]
MQDQYNLIQREEEKEVHPLCQLEGIAVLPWSPLARGKLTRPGGETTARSVSDNVMEKLYTGTEENDAAIAERAGNGGCGQRRDARAGGAGMAAA